MSNNLVVRSREYKVVLNHRMFSERKIAAAALRHELGAMVARLDGIKFEGEFEKTKKRSIVFLDTPDETILLNQLVLRQRIDLEEERVEYTLKCRSPDRYIASGTDVSAADKDAADEKLEEDISAPFVSRFSHSTTVPGPAKLPEKLGTAAELYPVLSKLERDGERCPGHLRLRPVNSLEIYERVITGPVFLFHEVAGEAALILWSEGSSGRPLAGELSFRYRQDQEKFKGQTARLAMKCFGELQHMDWSLPEGRTKTQFIYSAS